MTDIINEKLGAWLLDSSHNRQQLADEIGITRPCLRDRLNGRTKWNWDEVLRVAEITGCTLDELAGRKGAN